LKALKSPSFYAFVTWPASLKVVIFLLIRGGPGGPKVSCWQR